MFSDTQRNILFKLRSRMLEEVRANFKKQYLDQSCLLKCSITHIDSQQNMLICKKLKENVKYSEVKYTYIFIEEIRKQLKITNTYLKFVKERKKLKGIFWKIRT